MVASQLNIRLNPAQRKKVDNNARIRGIKPTDYVRQLIENEINDTTAAEWQAYVRQVSRACREKTAKR